MNARFRLASLGGARLDFVRQVEEASRCGGAVGRGFEESVLARLADLLEAREGQRAHREARGEGRHARLGHSIQMARGFLC